MEISNNVNMNDAKERKNGKDETISLTVEGMSNWHGNFLTGRNKKFIAQESVDVLWWEKKWYATWYRKSKKYDGRYCGTHYLLVYHDLETFVCEVTLNEHLISLADYNY